MPDPPLAAAAAAECDNSYSLTVVSSQDPLFTIEEAALMSKITCGILYMARTTCTSYTLLCCTTLALQDVDEGPAS